jgi:NAD(P)-dependent dehydrogenase (short-subunit alcohol dehydrogenase family)
MDKIASKTRTNEAKDSVPQALKDKIALVTGSCSGIGAAVARELSSRGASIVLNYPYPDLKADAEAIGATLTSKWIAVQADISTTDGPTSLVQAAVAEFGKIDILVNNAAVARLAKFDETDAELWDIHMLTNVRGAFLVTKAVLPHLPTKASGGGGRIVCITSAVATQPEIHQAAYATSKGALATLTRAMAKELPPKYGCTVNAVSPGIVKTPQFLRELQKDGGGFLTSIFDARTPLDGWVGLPEDVAHAVGFLTEERSSWVNGASINVSGGMFLD